MPKTWAYICESGWRVVGHAKSGHIQLEHPRAGKAQIQTSTSDPVRGDLNTRTRLRRREAMA
jgi:hypothetical protein